jgi:hypothetical protein
MDIQMSGQRSDWHSYCMTPARRFASQAADIEVLGHRTGDIRCVQVMIAIARNSSSTARSCSTISMPKGAAFSKAHCSPPAAQQR